MKRSKPIQPGIIVSRYLPDEAERDAKPLYFQVDRQERTRTGQEIHQHIARVLVGKGMTTRRARSIARRIAGDPSEVPRVAGVVDMRSRRPIPTFTLEAPGPDGWSKAPKGLLEALSC